MVQQVAEAQKALDDYASCLGEFFSDLTALPSFDTAVELAEHLQFNQKLKFREPRKATKSKARGGFGPAVGLQSRRKVS